VKLSTTNPGTIFEAIKIINASIINVNKPNVSIVTGRDKNDSIGFTKIFSTAMTKETIRATENDSTLTPDNR